jgi:hypothetical protein
MEVSVTETPFGGFDVKHFLITIAALLMITGSAEARPRRAASPPPECNVIMPCDFGMSVFAASSEGAKIKRRSQNAKTDAFFSNPLQRIGVPVFTAAGAAIARPARYIGGRLICAVNLNAALAERGIKGTGSALAHSFDHWGVRSPVPVPGAVAVTDRRGGGHVALISRVEGGRVFAWNPSSRGRGWREVEYTGRHARYRVAG